MVFPDDKVPKKDMLYTCIACIIIDFVMKIKKEENDLQPYLQECKYKVKKKKMPGFIDVKLKSDSDSE